MGVVKMTSPGLDPAANVLTLMDSFEDVAAPPLIRTSGVAPIISVVVGAAMMLAMMDSFEDVASPPLIRTSGVAPIISYSTGGSWMMRDSKALDVFWPKRKVWSLSRRRLAFRSRRAARRSCW